MSRIFDKKNFGDVRTVKEEIEKLSYSDLYAIQSMAILIATKGNYHKDYIRFYQLVIEEIRLELDSRIQHKIFRHGF